MHHYISFFDLLVNNFSVIILLTSRTKSKMLGCLVETRFTIRLESVKQSEYVDTIISYTK